jgi:hypothetical protein
VRGDGKTTTTKPKTVEIRLQCDFAVYGFLHGTSIGITKSDQGMKAKTTKRKKLFYFLFILYLACSYRCRSKTQNYTKKMSVARVRFASLKPLSHGG